MTARAPVLVVSARGALVPRTSAVLALPSDGQTVTVGSAGALRVVGPGVNPVHAYLRYSRNEIYAAAADPEHATAIGGAPVGVAWKRIAIPAELSLGNVTLRLELGGSTRASSTPPPPRRPAPLRAPPPLPKRAFAKPVLPNPSRDSERTLCDASLQSALRAAGRDAPSHVPPSPKPRSPNAAPRSLPFDDAMRARAQAAARGAFGSARWPRSVAYASSFLIPLALAFHFVRIMPISAAQADPPAARPAPALTAPTAPTTRPQSPSPPSTASEPPAPAHVAPETGSSSRSAPTPTWSAPSSRGDDGPTLERRAIDAFALGAYDDAARIYDELARTSIGPSAFAEAAAAARRRASSLHSGSAPSGRGMR